MKRVYLVEAAGLVIEQLPQARQRALPFSSGIPGKKWVRSFYQRNKDVLNSATRMCKKENDMLQQMLSHSLLIFHRLKHCAESKVLILVGFGTWMKLGQHQVVMLINSRNTDAF